MPFKPNYNFQKLERERAKAAKKEERLRRKQAGETAIPEEDADAADPDAPPAAERQD